jgi:hypothetical protein
MSFGNKWCEKGSNGSRRSTRERRVVRKACSRQARRAEAALMRRAVVHVSDEVANFTRG